MEKFKINLLNQQSRNEAHMRNLSRFMQNESRFSALSFKEQQLIRRQVEAMEALDTVLKERLKIHGFTSLLN